MCTRRHAPRSPRPARGSRRGGEAGLTLLEMMIVLAIIGGLVVITAVGLRKLTKGELVDDAQALAARFKQASSLALETGVAHRVTLDLGSGGYLIERCEGRARMIRARDQAELGDKLDPARAAELLAEAQTRMGQATGDLMTATTSEDAAAVTAAIAGHHVGTSPCLPAIDGNAAPAAEGEAAAQAAVTEALAGGSGAAPPKGALAGQVRGDAGLKIKQVFTAYLESPATTGPAFVWFFPDGSASKTIVELTDGDAVFSVLVHGLTARVELRDEALREPDDFLLRNPLGDKEAER